MGHQVYGQQSKMWKGGPVLFSACSESGSPEAAGVVTGPGAGMESLGKVVLGPLGVRGSLGPFLVMGSLQRVSQMPP